MKNLPAFSLIEMSIVLIIMGIVAGATLPVVNSMLLSHRRHVTVEKQERVLKALGAYYAEKTWLPRPAQLDTDGEESEDISSRFGIVPYKTLGIPESDAKDAYNHWMTYGVNSARMKKAENKTAHQYNHDEEGLGNGAKNENSKKTEELIKKEIFIYDDGGKKNCLHGANSPVLLVLISHGPQGSGALGGPPAKEGTDEYINSADARGQTPVDIIDRPLSLAKENPFLHRVRWEVDRNFRQNYAHTKIKPLSTQKEPFQTEVKPELANNDVDDEKSDINAKN